MKKVLLVMIAICMAFSMIGVSSAESESEENAVVVFSDNSELTEDEIALLKNSLKTLGYYNSTIDGKLNEDLTYAVRLYQAAYYLPITGIADKNLLGHVTIQATTMLGTLHPYMEGMYYGYLNYDGEIAIHAKYEKVPSIGSGIGYFSDGLASVYKNSKWGYIDSQGNEVIKPTWYDAREFSEGRAFVQKESKGKWAIIDTEGKLITDYIFDNKSQFLSHAIMRTAAQFTGLGYSFSNGLAPVCKGEKWGYVNTDGEVVIDYQFDEAYVFKGGYASVLTKGSGAVIDTEGNYVIQPGKYASIGVYGSSRFVVKDKSEKPAVIDVEGNTIVPFGTYKSIGLFREGKSVVEKKDGTFAFIDIDGKEIIKLGKGIKRANPFRNGIAMIEKDSGTVEYIDINGKVITSGSWLEPHEFMAGLAEVWVAKGQLAYFKADGSKLTNFSTGYGHAPATGSTMSSSDFVSIATEYLKKHLKNPASLQVHSASGYSSGEYFVVMIDYSAMNGFGGYNRETYICMIEQGSGTVAYAYSN